MLFVSFFKSLIEKNVTLKFELKNGLEISGVLNFVDSNMNFNLTQIIVDNSETQPQLISLKNCFIRGSVIRMIHIPGHEVDTELLEDACKKEMKQEKLG